MKKEFKCKYCGKSVVIDNERIPECCGNKMEEVPLDVCLQPAHPEHARPMDDDEPCDDGRAG